MLVKHHCILLIIIFLLLFNGCHNSSNYLQTVNSKSCPEYEIIKDDLGIFIEVAVDEKISKEQMECILIDVADKHQFDKARDYLWSNYLWIEIYFKEKGTITSQNPCGRLRRLVSRDKLENTSNPENKFFFSTEKCIIE